MSPDFIFPATIVRYFASYASTCSIYIYLALPRALFVSDSVYPSIPKQSSKQARKQLSKQVSKQLSKQATEQLSKQASKPATD